MLTLAQALSRFLLIHDAEQTRQTYERFLTRFVASIGPDRPVEIINPEDIDTFVRAMKKRRTKYATHSRRPVVNEPLSPYTVYKNVKMIKTFFTWCEKNGLITASPASFLHNTRPRRPLGQGKAATDDELDAMLAAARFKPRDLALVLLVANSGCRAGETASLRISDLDLSHRCALVDGKGNVRRRIYFDAETVRALETWLRRRPKANHEYVFTSIRGSQPLQSRGVSDIIRRLCKTAGIRVLGAHSLRHRIGLKFARELVSPRVAQHYLGHSNVNTTMEYYTGIDEDDLRRAGELLNNRGEGPE